MIKVVLSSGGGSFPHRRIYIVAVPAAEEELLQQITSNVEHALAIVDDLRIVPVPRLLLPLESETVQKFLSNRQLKVTEEICVSRAKRSLSGYLSLSLPLPPSSLPPSASLSLSLSLSLSSLLSLPMCNYLSLSLSRSRLSVLSLSLSLSLSRSLPLSLPLLSLSLPLFSFSLSLSPSLWLQNLPKNRQKLPKNCPKNAQNGRRFLPKTTCSPKFCQILPKFCPKIGQKIQTKSSDSGFFFCSPQFSRGWGGGVWGGGCFVGRVGSGVGERGLGAERGWESSSLQHKKRPPTVLALFALCSLTCSSLRSWLVMLRQCVLVGSGHKSMPRCVRKRRQTPMMSSPQSRTSLASPTLALWMPSTSAIRWW